MHSRRKASGSTSVTHLKSRRRCSYVVMAGLLTCSDCDAFPDSTPVAVATTLFVELTAAGTVTDFHRVPYYEYHIVGKNTIFFPYDKNINTPTIAI